MINIYKKLKRFIYVLVLLSSTSTIALPDSVEIIFLSPPRMTKLLKLINEKYTSNSFLHSPYRALASNEDCTPMGDGCFHPQKGYFPKKENPIKKKDSKDVKSLDFYKDSNNEKLKTINSLETEMIDCKKEYYFDLYCGKAKKVKVKKSDFSIWVDTSSSMKNVDYSNEEGFCKRREFVQGLMNLCPKVSLQDVFMFDTGIKQLGTKESLCLNYGMNNKDKFIGWIKRSNAKKLLILTDIDEMSQEVREYLDSIGAKIHGGDVEDFTAKDLSAFVTSFASKCK